MSGQKSYFSGLAAESSVARHYCERGFELVGTRWRGKSGEIDLILRNQETYVFAEVKKARTHAEALHRLSQRQIGRIIRAATEYVGTLVSGQLTPMRFDLAVVDDHGAVDLCENAFWQG